MVTPPSPRRRRPCLAVLDIPGLLYLRIERCPRWLPHILTAAGATVGGWLLARHLWLLTRLAAPAHR